jgi:hypothetical protein
MQMTSGNNLSDRVKSPLKFAIVNNISHGADGFFKPVLGPLLQNRRMIIVLITMAMLQVALTAARVSVWQCPLHSTLGVPCPGCGLTRAIVLFIQGHWQASISLHVFAPIVLAVGILLATGCALPARLQQKMVAHVTDFERRTGIAALLILSAIIYWILKISHFIQTG